MPAAVTTVMADGGQHAWTLDDMRAALIDRAMPVDASSVFRAVQRLESDGVIRRLELSDGKSHFELADEHHDHLRCDACGALAAVPCGVLDTMLSAVERQTGFAVTGHQLVLTGKCHQCTEARVTR